MNQHTIKDAGTDETICCPICKSEKPRFLFENEDFIFGYPESFPLYRCGDCGHIFLVGFTPEMLDDLYTNYYPRSTFDIENYKPYSEHKGFMAWLDGDNAYCHCYVPPNVRVLDIGCGSCETLGF
ncbi:MAG: hypothetical protein LBU65_16030, partial [Planctomycetaceae bacterium]|nr:hypothetical protein [Planctomycetaceae bacterium]